ncbi:MAG: hypothetical protein LUD16_12250 [Lachnospiraceae bacterium]|nr:hypothetical protein [Lachnospiraceae bacterium]
MKDKDCERQRRENRVFQENSDQDSGKFFSIGLLAVLQKEKMMSVS